MNGARVDWLGWSLGSLLLAAAPWPLWAGGSGLNTVVVLNQASSNSIVLGNYFCERRQVPPQNVLRIAWADGNTSWTLDQLQAALALPLEAMLTGRGLSHQVDTVVLSMDIPYRVTSSNGINSTTAVLFYGFKPDAATPPGLPGSCSLPPASTNVYALSERGFRELPPGTNVPRFLATMLTAPTLATALRLVDQGVSSDSTFPTQPVLLEKTTDPARNVRFSTFDNAIFNVRLNGSFPAVSTNSSQTAGLTNLFGLQTGLAGFSLSANSFVPGALGDSLTSYGGYLFEPSGQTSLLEFIQAGAAGSYGTVVEPCNYLEKFPDPLAYFYQARGFSLLESYSQSLQNPYQGIIVAEPLAAPFASPGSAQWVGLSNDAVVTETQPLSLRLLAADGLHPVQQVDLFVDGTWLETLTNLPPAPGNTLFVTLNGFRTNYIVPTAAALPAVAAALAAVLNSLSNQTRVVALPGGDRIELQSTDLSRPGAQTLVTVSNGLGAAPGLTTFLRASRPDFLDGLARGYRTFQISGSAAAGDALTITVTRTNGVRVALSVTNPAPPLGTIPLAQQLLALINATPALQGPDGVSAEDTYPDGGTNLSFLLFARTPGPAAAQLQVALTVSASLRVSPNHPRGLDENLGDLRPRNHLYLTAGATNLSFSFLLDSTALADGFHSLIAVGYEGSSVRTQTRCAQTIYVHNTSLSAVLASSAPLGVAALSDLLQFTVTAHPDPITRIELCSTGGSLGVVSNQPTASFSVAAIQLGVGLHPFFARVTGPDGQQFQTGPQYIRLTDTPPVPAFPIAITASPVQLTWPAVAGHAYEILSADRVSGMLQSREILTVTNTGYQGWTEPQPGGSGFYRVRALP